MNLGVIRIYRGAIYPDGTVVKMDNHVLWEHIGLDEDIGFDQGDVVCS